MVAIEIKNREAVIDRLSVFLIDSRIFRWRSFVIWLHFLRRYPHGTFEARGWPVPRRSCGQRGGVWMSGRYAPRPKDANQNVGRKAAFKTPGL